jgi:hypothetical protein
MEWCLGRCVMSEHFWVQQDVQQSPFGLNGRRLCRWNTTTGSGCQGTNQWSHELNCNKVARSCLNWRLTAGSLEK